MPPRAQSKPKSTGASVKVSAPPAVAVSPEELEALKQGLIKRLISTGEWNRSVEELDLSFTVSPWTNRFAHHESYGLKLSWSGRRKLVGYIER